MIIVVALTLSLALTVLFVTPLINAVFPLPYLIGVLLCGLALHAVNAHRHPLPPSNADSRPFLNLIVAYVSSS
jgi:hypothetical protein